MSNSEEILYKKKFDLADSVCHSAPLKEFAAELLCDKGCNEIIKSFKNLSAKKSYLQKSELSFDADPISSQFKKFEQE